MWLQAAAIALLPMVSSYGAWMVAAVLMGVGTALVYPTLLAVVADVADPSWRASAIGAYRLWRDLGYAIGGLTAGVIADAVGMRAAFVAVAVMTALSGIVVAIRMDTSQPGSRKEVVAIRTEAR